MKRGCQLEKENYLRTFYKPNNIKTKPSIKVRTYIQI